MEDMEDMEQFETLTQGLTSRQLTALEACAERQPGETDAEVAQRAGISRTTLWRYMSDPTFKYALQSKVCNLFYSRMASVMRGLANAAEKGDAGCQRIYWQMSGKLKESIEIADRREIVTPTINVDNLSLEFREELLRQVKTIKGNTPDNNTPDNTPVHIPDIRRPGYIDVAASNPTTNPTSNLSDNLSDNLDLFTIDAIESEGPNDPVNEPVNGNGHKPLSVAELLSKL